MATKHKLATSGGARSAPIIKHNKKAIFLFFTSVSEGNIPANPSKEKTTGISNTIAKIKTMVIKELK
jgi:hypothetical protein